MTRPRNPAETVPGYTCGPALQNRLDRLLHSGGVREEIGRSREGRPIMAFRWDRSTGAGPRRGILLLSLLHPMEWIGLEAHLALLEGWILAPETGGPPAGTPIYSIPVANPDGLARVEDSLLHGRSRWVRGNCAGVDLNRNFPVGHRARTRLLDWWPLYRPGPRPLSEPETAAIAHWAESLDLALALSLHSFGRRIFYPLCCTGARKPEGARHHAALVETGIAPPSGSAAHPYRAGQLGRWSPFFRAHGTEIDFLQAGGALAYLVEISQGGFGRWGWRRLLHPFYLFNPPEPEKELSLLLPLLRRLSASCGAGGRYGVPGGSPGRKRST
jgi:hypothetical protein